MFRSTCVYRTELVENKPEITKTPPRHATATTSFARGSESDTSSALRVDTLCVYSGIVNVYT